MFPLGHRVEVGVGVRVGSWGINQGYEAVS